MISERDAEKAAELDANTPSSGHLIINYKLAQFGTLGVIGLIKIFEENKVPWGYRVCGDANREFGIEELLLSNEPTYYQKDIFTAAVVFLVGNYIDIQREKKQCGLGNRFCQLMKMAFHSLTRDVQRLHLSLLKMTLKKSIHRPEAIPNYIK